VYVPTKDKTERIGRLLQMPQPSAPKSRKWRAGDIAAPWALRTSSPATRV